MVGQFVPLLTQFLGSKGGADVASLLAGRIEIVGARVTSRLAACEEFQELKRIRDRRLLDSLPFDETATGASLGAAITAWPGHRTQAKGRT